jgi:hypothetical protein
MRGSSGSRGRRRGAVGTVRHAPASPTYLATASAGLDVGLGREYRLAPWALPRAQLRDAPRRDPVDDLADRYLELWRLQRSPAEPDARALLARLGAR